jgi:large subunit ribosomal protein L17
MRHGRKLRKLNFYSAQRSSLLRNMTVSLIMTENVTTTDARAKEIKRYAEKIITLCKDDSLATRRRAFAYLRSKEALQKLYGSLRDRYIDQKGGYVRIFHAGFRKGDAAEMCIIKLG